jgi:hypothetical protein
MTIPYTNTEQAARDRVLAQIAAQVHALDMLNAWKIRRSRAGSMTESERIDMDNDWRAASAAVAKATADAEDER